MSKSIFDEKSTAGKTAPKKASAKDAPAPKVEKGPAPKEGGKTRVVWDILDKLAGKGLSRKDMLKACTDAKVNQATAATQYGLWRANKQAEKKWEPIQKAMDATKAKAKEAAAKAKAAAKPKAPAKKAAPKKAAAKKAAKKAPAKKAAKKATKKK